MPTGRGLLVTSGTLHQQPGLFFHLIQSELGDLYKVRALAFLTRALAYNRWSMAKVGNREHCSQATSEAFP